MTTPLNTDFSHPFIAKDETFFKRYTFSVAFMRWLLTNHHPVNRPIDTNRVAAIKADIIANKWFNRSGNLVKVDVAGNIIDGHHRMIAHVDLKRDMVSSVLYGLPTKAINFQDTVRPRSAADNAVIFDGLTSGIIPTDHDFCSKRLQMRVAKWYVMGTKMMNGETNPSRRLSEVELNEALACYRNQLMFDLEIATSRHTKRPGFLSALAIYRTKAPHKALAFRDQMTGIRASQPVVTLRDYLLKKSAGGSQPRYDHFNTVAAINAFHFGRDLDKLTNSLRTSWAM